MKWQTSLTVISCLLAAPFSASGGEVFRCTDSAGRAVFSQTRCGPDAQGVALNVYHPTPMQDLDASRRLLEDSIAARDAVERQRIATAEMHRRGAIRALNASYEQEQGAIAERRSRANNNLAGATLEGALASDKAASDANYRAAMEQLNR